MPPALLFAIAWIGWIVTWIAAAFWSGRTQKRVNTWEVWVYRVASLAGLVLLNHRTARALGSPRLWHVGLDGAYTLAALTFGGILFAWWARIHLGRLWSGSITVKEGHRVVDTGPYGLVRHPIYTGLIFAVIATAVAQATVTGLAAIALITIGLWLKARVEERFLATELGPDDYAAYRRRVPMLVPFIPAGG
jgi:protein-S-isoprenylcysteine O-methyltransferase Ste14